MAVGDFSVYRCKKRKGVFMLRIFNIILACLFLFVCLGVNAQEKTKIKSENKVSLKVKAKAELELAAKMAAEAEAKIRKAQKMEAEAKAQIKAASKARAKAQAEARAKKKEKSGGLLGLSADLKVNIDKKLEAQLEAIARSEAEAQSKLKVCQKLEAQAKAQEKEAKETRAHGLYLKGKAYYKEGKKKKALVKLKASTKTSLHASSHKAFHLMGKLEAEVGNKEKAKHCYEQAVKIKPGFKKAQKALAEINASLKIKVGVSLFGDGR